MDGEAAFWATVAIIALAASGLLGALLLGPIGRALGDRIRGRPRGADLDAVVADLDHRLTQLEEGQGRLAELEERLDFAERMLTGPRRPTTPVPGE